MPELRTISHTDTATTHTVIAVAGELDIATAEPFRAEVVQAIAAAASGDRVVVDCTDLSFIDSSGLQAMIQCLKLSQRSGKHLFLAAPSPRVVQILRISALDSRLPAYPTVAEALAAPADRGPGSAPSAGSAQ